MVSKSDLKISNSGYELDIDIGTRKSIERDIKFLNIIDDKKIDIRDRIRYDDYGKIIKSWQ